MKAAASAILLLERAERCLEAVSDTHCGMSADDLVLTRDQRAVLYDSVKLNLSGIGDISMLPAGGRDQEAVELRWQYVLDDMRLLDDLGWDYIDPRESYPLTMPKTQLVRIMRRHQDLAAGSLEDQADFLRKSRDRQTAAEEWSDFRDQARRCADEDLALLTVCAAVLWAMGEPPAARLRTAEAGLGGSQG